ADDERAVEFQRHRLGQAALVQLQLGTDDDHRTPGVVHALTEQVAAEATLLPLEHIAEGLEFAPSAAAERLPALAVVDQAVHRFLKHTLLVAHDNIRCAEFKQVLEAVVAVDHAAVQVVQVAGGETSTVQLHHRAQVGRDHGQYREDHPLRTVVALAQAFDHAQTLGRLLLALLAASGADFVPQF